MDDLKEVVSLLFQLVPGFIAAWILYGLSSYPKPSQFERLVQALVFSFLIKVFVISEHLILLWIGRYWTLASWDNDAELLAGITTGILLGLVGSYFANNDKLYAAARALNLSTRTAFPSEWYGAFSRSPRYIVLHLKDRRRIYGWPLQWPSDPNVGYFELVEYLWLPEAEVDIERVLNSPVEDDSILVPTANVEFVEILRSVQEPDNGPKAIQSSPA